MSERSKKIENRTPQRLAGICGILGSILPIVMVLTATFLSSWFSWNLNALSELGVGEQAVLFNSAVLIGGALNLVFAIGLCRYLNDGKLTRTGIVLIIASSVSLAFVGVFTIDYLVLHGIAASGYFVLAPAGFLLAGLGDKGRAIRKLSFACGIIALFAILVLPILIMILPFKIGFAVPELIESLAISGWTLPMSTKLIGQTR